MWRALIAWLAGLFRRGVVATGQAAGRARRRVLGPSYPADPVRRVYAQLLYRAARHGLERQPTVTPAEFQQRLEAWWPESADDFAAVTRAYIRRRYGDVTPDEAEIRRVREHWRNIRTAMRTPHEA